MKKKFTHLISCCFALLLLGSGTAWGQGTVTYWNGQVCHLMDYYAPSCSIVQIGGLATMTYYRWASDPLAAIHSWDTGSTSNNCGSSLTKTDKRLVWDASGNWTTETRSCTRTCTGGSGGSGGSLSGWSCGAWGSSSSVSLTGTPHTTSTSWVEVGYSGTVWSDGHGPHGHTNATNYHTITVNLPSVINSVDFLSPSWRHDFVQYALSWDGSNNPVVSVTYPSSTSGNLPNGVMNSNGSEIRFTGSKNQIEKPSGSTLTSATLSLPNKIWFDQLWDGAYNNVAITGWNPVSQGVQGGQTLGFWHGYEGSNIIVNNGKLLLGEDASCPDQNFSVTSSSLVTIDAYNTNGAPAGCITMPTVVTYNPVGGSQPTVAGNMLNITNTNGGCNQVDFCSFFNPTFSGNGVLLIDPNVTNFKQGATFTTAQTGNINIFSNKITTTGDFLYTSTRSAGDLDIIIKNPQNPICDDCGFFNVSNDFTTNISAATGGKISITDDTPNAKGHVEIGRNLTHTGSTGADLVYTTDVDNYIYVDGTTLLTANRDDITFNSSESWIRFGSSTATPFTYTSAGGATPLVSDLVITASGMPCSANACGFTGGFVLFNGAVTTTNVLTGTTTLTSTNDSVSMFDGFTHTGVNGNMTTNGYSGVELTGDVVTINRKTTQTTTTPAIWDRIISPAGQVHVGEDFTYNLDKAVQGGLLVEASQNGYGCTPICGSYGGYVWMESPVLMNANVAGVVPANNEGTVTVRSNGHFVRMDDTYTHKGHNGNMLVEALGDCSTTCSDIMGAGVNVFGSAQPKREEGYLFPGHSLRTSPNMAYTGRPAGYNGGGYVWIQGAVDIDVTATATPEGNVTIHSAEDIVQFDQTVNFDDKLGSNLLVDGDKGVRTIGVTTINQTDYDPISNQGTTHYLSDNGFVDFWSNFNYTAKSATATGGDRKSALDIDGSHRVEFLAPVVIDMGKTSGKGTIGHVDIFSNKGWVDVQSTFKFDGTDGDLITWANGNGTNIGLRSCVDSTHTCDDVTRAGFVHYNDDVTINYTNLTEGRGKTWIRSYFDDVKIDQNLSYTSQNGVENGLFLMQSGQDIYGISDAKDTPESTNAHATSILFTQPGEQGIMMQAKKTIHIVQDLIFNRTDAQKGDVTMSAGYMGFVDTADVRNDGIDPKQKGSLWSETSLACTPNNYQHRYACQSGVGGDIWFEGDVLVDLSGANATGNTIKTTMRAWKSLFIDQNYTYNQATEEGGDVFLFAHTGNLEAIEGSVNAPASPIGSVAGTKVLFDITNPDNNEELRLQAGNQPNGSNRNRGGECMPNVNCSGLAWAAPGKEFEGNILFNKPLTVNHEGLGYTILSASRDIENQLNAPFVFTYNHTNITDSFVMTAGRHVETHNVVTFNYPNQSAGKPNQDQIIMQAGRLGGPYAGCADNLCKTIELGTSLTQDVQGGANTDPYDPSNPSTTTSPALTLDNEFAKGGAGQGSILMFDSVVFNYNGKGGILMTALNGNIESDPYLHRSTKGTVGYDGQNNVHDAQLTFNHGGAGVTRLEAIDIKLHDKLAYYAIQHANDSNGRFYMAAYDSILTRNIEYRNHLDSGSVFITTDKYKNVSPNADCGQYYTAAGGPGIHQGHIVLGYGADCTDVNYNDSIIFDFNSTALNNNTVGANLFIKAGYLGFTKNTVTGKGNSSKLFNNRPEDKDKAYGGNITFDFMKINMAKGNATAGGYTEISTPNGNIWGKDSIQYHGINGHLLVDAGLGSLDDTLRASRWSQFKNDLGAGSEKTLNTQVPYTCDVPGEWRTGNIMMKGGSLNFHDVTNPGNAGTGNAVFRTREGFIDTYDAFTVDSMSGDLLKYAGTSNNATEKTNQWGDVSERDFFYTPIEKSGSIFFGADDNIMMNYGYSNDARTADGYIYGGVGQYPVGMKLGNFTALAEQSNPYYWTTYMNPSNGFELCRAIYNVNEDGYMWYRNVTKWPRTYHKMYRGCKDESGRPTRCSGFAGQCETIDNFARPLMFNFAYDANNQPIQSGGLGIVATNYIDMFTKFTYFGGDHKGMSTVPGMSTLHGESVSGYGLYMKSQFTGQQVEKRRATCEGCSEFSSYPIGGKVNSGLNTYEWTYIGFHDDARIHTNNQKSLLEAPVIEFFGHAELDAYHERGTKTDLMLKGDSLIFHDSAIFEGAGLQLLPFTTDDRRQNDMRYGVINDRGESSKYYREYGVAIAMPDRNTPVIEFGYQRCNEPDRNLPHETPNQRSKAGFESTPRVGGDIIVTFKYDFSLPILNSVVANHARISFITDSIDKMKGGEFIDACVRTDLLRIRNKVEFYTDPLNSMDRRGTLKMTSNDQMPSAKEAGIFPHHLHLEPGSELSIPGEDSLVMIATTTVGGYGNLHENVFVKANGIIAPGYSSLMEGDCQTPYKQGKLTIHDLNMEKDAVLRISIGGDNCQFDPVTKEWNLNCTQTDTLLVQDTIYMRDKVKLEIMPETEYLDYGCYLFLEYGDSLGRSKEYVKNLTLARTRFNDYFFGLDYSTPGKVYLCVMSVEQPIVQRYVELPAVTGVTTNPGVGTHYVQGHQNFSFTARYSGSPLKVTATGAYGGYVDLDQTAVILADGTYQYTLYQVVQPWTVFIGPEASTVSNDNIANQKVWTHKNTLYIHADREDIVSIYNLTGVLYKKVEISEGLQKFTLERGVYVVTLKDGSVHKIVIK